MPYGAPSLTVGGTTSKYIFWYQLNDTRIKTYAQLTNIILTQFCFSFVYRSYRIIEVHVSKNKILSDTLGKDVIRRRGEVFVKRKPTKVVWEEKTRQEVIEWEKCGMRARQVA